MPKVSILIAIGNTERRNRIAGILRGCAEFNVVASAASLMETFNLVEEHSPKAVVISRALTRSEEFTVMRGLFQAMQIRWITVESGTNNPTSADKETPRGSGLFAIRSNDRPERILEHVQAVLRVGAYHQNTARPARGQYPASNNLILIGSSTGGVDALVQVLSQFPPNCPPTLIVQHTGDGFGQSLVRLLDRNCAAQVLPAQDGAPIKQGTVLLGGGLNRHLVIAPPPDKRVTLVSGTPQSGHRPSIDALFASAVPYARSVVAALLTGMGRDGAAGLLKLRKAGARTYGQDEKTSIVYGMPRVAAEMGAVEKQLPIDQIAAALLSAGSRQRAARA